MDTCRNCFFPFREKCITKTPFGAEKPFPGSFSRRQRTKLHGGVGEGSRRSFPGQAPPVSAESEMSVRGGMRFPLTNNRSFRPHQILSSQIENRMAGTSVVVPRMQKGRHVVAAFGVSEERERFRRSALRRKASPVSTGRGARCRSCPGNPSGARRTSRSCARARPCSRTSAGSPSVFPPFRC